MKYLAGAVGIPDFVATTAFFNGMPGARIYIGGADTAVSLVVEDGRITRIYAIRNPHKLGWLDKMAELRR
jgi:RNA polymerase sigma-70 factor (ECF subfamily)